MGNDKTTRLRKLMRDHHLSISDVSKILGRSATTVRIWRCKSASRVIPDNELRLLELTIGGQDTK